MLSREGKQTDRGAVGAEFIGYNRRRREALLLQEFPHQPNCRPSVPAGLNQEIQDFALTVHGTPEIELPPSNYDDHLVQVPAFGRSWPPTLNPPRIGPTEFQDPSSNCLIRDVETTLGKQVLNVPIAQRETAIEPDGMLDDDRWKAVTTVGYLAHPETLKHRPCRSHAVNVTMPRRALRLAHEHAGKDRRRPPAIAHPRTPALELRTGVKLKFRWAPRTAYRLPCTAGRTTPGTCAGAPTEPARTSLVTVSHSPLRPAVRSIATAAPPRVPRRCRFPHRSYRRFGRLYRPGRPWVPHPTHR